MGEHHQWQPPELGLKAELLQQRSLLIGGVVLQRNHRRQPTSPRMLQWTPTQQHQCQGRDKHQYDSNR